MNVVIKSWSSDPDIDLATFKSNGPYCIGVDFGIGLDDNEGEEIFGFMVCNFEGLMEYHRKIAHLLPETFLLNGYIIQESFSFEKLKRHIQILINDLDAQDWSDLILKLEAIFGWEYSQELRSNGRIKYTFEGEWP